MDTIKKEEVTTMGVNPYWLNLLSDEYEKSSNRYNLSTLRTMYVSGSILDQSTLEKANRIFYNTNIYNVYGLSEAAPRVTAQQSYCCNGNSVGKPIRGVELIIVDDDGKEVNKGERGIVHIKTPCLYSGYILGSKKHISLRKDWFNTGDIGYLDNCGELHIVGRVDDVAIINSHKIYPYDIAMLIKSSTDIEECVVVKNDDNIISCLYVGPLHQPQYFISILKTLLIPYEIPKRFIQCKSIPRNSNGKFDYVLIKKIVNDQ